MQLDDILQVMANYLGTKVISLREVQFTPELLKTIPANVARMYQCLPVAMHDGTVQVALADPLDPGAAGRNPFCGQKGRAGGGGRPGRHREGD